MDVKRMSTMFRALGDPTRLRIFLLLKNQCCPVALTDSDEVRPVDGATVGEVCCHITGDSKISSTISFHLKELRQAGLITMEKRGRYVVCAPEPEAITELNAFLQPEKETQTL